MNYEKRNGNIGQSRRFCIARSFDVAAGTHFGIIMLEVGKIVVVYDESLVKFLLFYVDMKWSEKNIL